MTLGTKQLDEALDNHITKEPENDSLVCYGCDCEMENAYKFLKCEDKLMKMPFCKECATRLIKIKLGYI